MRRVSRGPGASLLALALVPANVTLLAAAFPMLSDACIGHKEWGPKLIYRLGNDVFDLPSGPEQAVVLQDCYQSTSTTNLARTIAG